MALEILVIAHAWPFGFGFKTKEAKGPGLDNHKLIFQIVKEVHN